MGELGWVVRAKRVALVALTALAASDPGILPGTSVAAAQEPVPGYDAAPLLSNLREAEREGLSARLGVERLEDLPLYELHVAVDDQLRGFGLRETITITHTERAPLSEVVLRVYANAVGTEPSVTLLEGRCLDGVACTATAIAPSTIRVQLARPLRTGERARIQLDLQGRMRAIDPARTTMMAQGLESLSGMMGEGPGGGDYGLLAAGDGIGSLANFFPVLARRERGRWIVDDGGSIGDLGTDQMAHVRARVVAPRAMQIVTSGVEVGSQPVRDAAGRPPRREVTVHAGAVRDFAILAGALESSARTVNGTVVRSWYLARDREAGRRVLDVAASALEIFERRFGAYPYSELDVVEAPLVGGAGGVEFTSLVTVASMFYQPASAGGLGALMGGDMAAMQGSMIEFVTAHEVAHQWWHGIVGSDSRMHPWVDESLAQYSAMIWVEDRYGAARADQEAAQQVAMNYRAMRMMGLPDGAVDRPASAFGPPIAYAGLVYGKGPYVYRAIRTELGDEAFFDGLRAYVARWRFGVAPTRGPIDALATGPHARRVRAIARRWLDETHGDEDLGGGDMTEVMAGMIPPEMRDQMRDPAVQALMRQMMQGMAGGDAAGGSEDGSAPAEGAEMMQQLQRTLGSLPESSSP